MDKDHITIWDRLMQLRLVRRFSPFLTKHREILLYLFFGGTAFFLNIVLFWLFDRFTPLNALISNGICWIICVLYQFVTNKNYVFQKESSGSILKQLLPFTGGRIMTLVIEEIILAAGIMLLGFSELPVKIIAQVVVIILNYVISKWFVFQ